MATGPWTQHPGAHIREELEARDWTAGELAERTGASEASINALLAGHRDITHELAQDLAAAFEVAPEFFLNLQEAYDQSRGAEARSA